MPGFNQQTLNNEVRNGNTVAILAGDQLIGFGQTSSFGVDFGTEQLYGIGSAKPQENQQLKFSLSLTLDTFQLTDAGLQAYGYNTTWLEVLANTEMDFHVVDKDGNALLTYVGCTARDFNLSIPANQIVTEATSFVGLDVLNKNGDSVLASNSAAVINAGIAAAGQILTAAGV